MGETRNEKRVFLQIKRHLFTLRTSEERLKAQLLLLVRTSEKSSKASLCKVGAFFFCIVSVCFRARACVRLCLYMYLCRQCVLYEYACDLVYVHVRVLTYVCRPALGFWIHMFLRFKCACWCARVYARTWLYACKYMCVIICRLVSSVRIPIYLCWYWECAGESMYARLHVPISADMWWVFKYLASYRMSSSEGVTAAVIWLQAPSR